MVVIIGTDTNAGKTVFSAALADAFRAHYWKPVQSGMEEGIDSQTVMDLVGLSPTRILPEVWKFPMPASPHIAARSAGVEIDVAKLDPPQQIMNLIIETAALNRRFINIKGVAFIGDEDVAAQQTIATIGGVHQLGRLPRLDPLNRETLRAAFAAHFSMQDFLI